MPKGSPGHHSAYIFGEFSLKPHSCVGNCSCVAAGCTQHWQWKSAPPSCNHVDKELYLWSAYRGNVPAPTKKQRFLGNYVNIVRWVRPLDGTTIFCNWNSKVVANVFNTVKAVFGGHTVPATKALYFFVPDLFIILDLEKVWGRWKTECAGRSILPRRIDNVNGIAYVTLMRYVRNKISSAINGGMAFTLDGSPPISVNSVDKLRLVTPLQIGGTANIGHTLGQVIDNIICGMIPGGTGPISIVSPPPIGGDE